jgi:hypothetical protein
MTDWGSVADWVTAVAAVGGLSFGALQIRSLQLANHAAVQLARANLLLTIDKEYEGDLFASRKAIRALRRRAEKAAQRKLGAGASHEALASAAAAEFTQLLTVMWTEAQELDEKDVEYSRAADRVAADRYAQMMQLPYWIETLGMLCKRDLLPRDDILDLYDAVIISTMRNFEAHVNFRRDEGPYPNQRFLENAYWLYNEAREFKTRVEAPTSHKPAKAKLPWRSG